MKKLIMKLFGKHLIQYKWGRKYIGGKFYYMVPKFISNGYGYWYDRPYLNIATIIKEEEY